MFIKKRYILPLALCTSVFATSYDALGRNFDRTTKSLSHHKKVSSSIVESENDFGLNGAAAACNNIKITAFQPEGFMTNGAFVDIANNCKGTISLDNLFLVDKNGRKHRLNERTMGEGDTLRVYFDSLGTIFSYGIHGELGISYEGTLTDYVAWGEPGSNAADAVSKGLWYDASEYILTDTRVYAPILQYMDGSFFRRLNQKDNSPENWQVYQAQDISNNAAAAPTPAQFALPNKANILPIEDSVVFSWTAVPTAIRYRLNIFDENKTLLQQVTTEFPSAKIKVPAGTYFWNVQSDNGVVSWGAPSSDNAYEVGVERDFIAQSAKKLNITPRAARKDTKLLVLGWGYYGKIRGWDISHVDRPHWDEEEAMRCWIVAAQELNQFFAKTKDNFTADIPSQKKYFLSQDEIKFHIFHKQDLKNPLNDFPLGHPNNRNVGGGSNDDVANAIKFALGISNVTVTEAISDDEVRTARNAVLKSIKSGYPAVIGEGQHIMVVDAYATTLSGVHWIRLLNPHNDGSFQWRKLNSVNINLSIEYDKNVTVRYSDKRIHVDSDEDGIMDFDEALRFGTNYLTRATGYDHDKDGINDKDEIWAYTSLEVPTRAAPSNDASSNPYNMIGNAWINGVKKEVWADMDNDGLRAEKDADSDGDGVDDGKDSDPFYAGATRYPYYLTDNLPDNIQLYSTAGITIGSNVNCGYFWYTAPEKKGTTRCSIASESTSSSYPVKISSSVVEHLYSKGAVHVRDGGNVPNLMYFTNSPYGISTAYSGSGTVQISATYPLGSWTWGIGENTETRSTGTGTFTVKSGSTYTISNGWVRSSLTVKSGATLNIEPGVMHFGSLIIEDGAIVKYTDRTKKTIIHVYNTLNWDTPSAYKSNGYGNPTAEAAQSVKAIFHGTNPVYLKNGWAGTVFAPKATLYLGSNQKEIWGRFLGKGIVIADGAKLRIVNFVK